MNLFPEIISVNLKLRYSWWKQLSSCAMLFLGGEENVFIYHFYNHQFTDLGNHLCGDCVSVYFIGKGFKKYLRTKPVREEKQKVCQTLGEMIKENRTRCKMTQEFVAESLGVSRQAVSKWENGTSDPSTSNLIALAKLFQIDASEMLKELGED